MASAADRAAALVAALAARVEDETTRHRATVVGDVSWLPGELAEEGSSAAGVAAGGRPLIPRASLLLTAALQLLEQLSPASEAPKHSVGAVLMSGSLRKSTMAVVPRWKARHVTVTAGLLQEASDEGSDVESVVRFDSPGWRCQVARQKRAVFEIVNDAIKGSRQLWQADDEASMQRWIIAVRSAMHGPAKDSDACDRLSSATAAASSKRQYLRAISGRATSIAVPLPWLRARTEVREEVDMGQVFRDMQRDRMSINGSLLHGTVGPDRLMLELASTIMAASRKRMAEATALQMARSVMLNCNRTQTGGDGYDAVSLLLANDIVVVCPLSEDAGPINVTVTDASASSLPSATVCVEMAVATLYKICSADPQDERNAVWLTASATFQQSVTFLEDASCVKSSGIVLVKTSMPAERKEEQAGHETPTIAVPADEDDIAVDGEDDDPLSDDALSPPLSPTTPAAASEAAAVAAAVEAVLGGGGGGGGGSGGGDGVGGGAGGSRRGSSGALSPTSGGSAVFSTGGDSDLDAELADLDVVLDYDDDALDDGDDLDDMLRGMGIE
eukprot:PLAT12518.4.p1 GENE.PLAT12518.4~~PLAT12518.4.p1  ORF type:complete len:559 (+),score=217.18 PLAT12518.4:291-1967(+)